jgi:hypothetical protein
MVSTRGEGDDKKRKRETHHVPLFYFLHSLEVYGAKITFLRAEPGSRPSTEAIADALSKTKFKMVTITHVDTS